MGNPDITVVIPTIPPRADNLLIEALNSVAKQTLKPEALVIEIDLDKEGAAVCRGRGLERVETEWVAFLDDDDYFYPNHLETLWNLHQLTDAWYLWSWFDGNNPFPMHRGREMDLENPHCTTMTVLVKTEMAKNSSFRPDPNYKGAGEDWMFQLGCIEWAQKVYGPIAPELFRGSSEVTWHYRVHKKNTSGLPTRW